MERTGRLLGAERETKAIIGKLPSSRFRKEQSSFALVSSPDQVSRAMLPSMMFSDHEIKYRRPYQLHCRQYRRQPKLLCRRPSRPSSPRQFRRFLSKVAILTLGCAASQCPTPALTRGYVNMDPQIHPTRGHPVTTQATELTFTQKRRIQTLLIRGPSCWRLISAINSVTSNSTIM